MPATALRAAEVWRGSDSDKLRERLRPIYEEMKKLEELEHGQF
jgi:hypothetical protein